MKISASIYSSKQRELEPLVKELEECGVDFIHVDCNDDPGVEEAIRRCRVVSTLPIDLHIISPEPEKFFGIIQEYGVEYVTIQYEDLGGRKPELPDLGCQYGLALMTDTANEVFDEFSKECSFVLFMTTTPGQSGGTFRKENFRKIRKFRRDYPGKKIHVDGGVNAEISFVLRNMGVYCSVSGSFLVNSESVAQSFLHLLVQKTDNHLFVRDVMYELPELPILPPDTNDVGLVLSTIEKYNMGYCLMVDNEGTLAGLISNADIRRGLLKHINDLSNLKVSSFINPSPKYINKDLTISEMLKMIKSFSFLALFLPVVDENKKLAGAVNFNNLILGEL